MTVSLALVTGGNKGIGYEIAKQLALAGTKVLLGARNSARGQAAANTLMKEGLDVSFLQIDICDGENIAAAAEHIENAYGRLDILVNNAGIADARDGLPGSTSPDTVRHVLETNFIGPLAVTQAMLPLLRKSSAGRIVNISSSLGSLTLNNDKESPFYNVKLIGYNTSKAALNMLTIQLNAELKDTAITAVSVCPGLVNTDLSGHLGDRTPHEAAAFPVRLALQTAPNNDAAFQNEAVVLPL